MNKRLLYVSLLIVISITILSRCVSGEEKKDIRGNNFAGSAACITCHKSIYDSYASTAHHNTSRPAADSTILGSFQPPDNNFNFTNGMNVMMESRDSGLYQSAYLNGKLQELHRFEIAIGSGRKAQTYLYFKGDQYFQLPLSYLVSAHNWANSPGFPASHPRFDRVVNTACFGCHTSMAAVKGIKAQGVSYTEQFEKGRVIYGIDCERCHGPAAEHVSFHTEHPQEKQARFITRIDTLKNQRKLDMCAVCHSGLKAPIQPVFNFRPGSALKDYFYPDLSRPNVAELDIHGTQYQLFTASQCFIQSKDMNCSSCHNPHATERTNMQVFSQRCMNCHSEANHDFCKLNTMPAATLAQNCIDCHMPALPSRAITLLTNGESKPTPDSIRTHLIGVYRPDAKGIIELVKNH
ncbi:MAG TPA: multiheme c-type cytochrome [Chitinophagaceae bacterium]|nr:multiheme c-type cytochrome [Chitinophagaceae bacterium]